jgi:hypothetical protein
MFSLAVHVLLGYHMFVCLGVHIVVLFVRVVLFACFIVCWCVALLFFSFVFFVVVLFCDC